MNDTPDSGGSIASDSIGIDEFLEEYDYNAAEVRRFQERMYYEDYVLLGIAVLFLLSFLTEYYRQAINDSFGLLILSALFPTAILILMVFHAHVMILTLKSPLSEERLAYYELTLAIQSNEDGDSDGTVKHLREGKGHLEGADLSDISDSTRQGILNYISAIENAANREQALQQTFDPFIAHIVTLIMTSNETELEALAKEVEQSPSESFSPFRRAAADITHGISSVFIGFWGIALIAIIAGLAANFLYSPTVGVGAVAAIFTAYVAYK